MQLRMAIWIDVFAPPQLHLHGNALLDGETLVISTYAAHSFSKSQHQIVSWNMQDLPW